MAKKKVDQEARHLELCIEHKNISGLVEILSNAATKAVYQVGAARGLVDVNTDESWAALMEFVRVHEGHSVELVLEAVGPATHTNALKVFREALGNPQVFVRMASTRALCRQGSSASFGILLRASRDPEAGIRSLATRTMVRRVDETPEILSQVRAATVEGVFEFLDSDRCMRLLADDQPEAIRLCAARRLGELGGENAIATLAAVLESSEGALAEACWRALESSNELSEFLLLPLVASKDPLRRARAIALYAARVDQNAVGILQAFLKDPHPSVRTTAIVNLHRLCGEDSLEFLKEAVKDEDDSVRLKAIQTMTKLESAAPELVEIVETTTGDFRRTAIICLATRGIYSPSLLMPYMEFLLKGSALTDMSQREYLEGLTAAARVLAKENSPEALLALTSMARSVIKRLRRIAVEAVMLYEPKERADALHSLLDTYDQDIIKNIAFGLHEVQDDRCTVPLIRAVYECKGRAVPKAKEALTKYEKVSSIDYLVGCLTARWPTVRRFGAERLRILKDQRAIPPLLAASRDPDVEVQLAVFEALGPFAAEVPEVTSRLIEAISYGDVSIRQAACEALGDATCAAAVPELIKALHNYFLRPRATDALRKIGDRKGYLALRRLERREALFKSRKKMPGRPSRSEKSKERRAAAAKV